MRRLRAVPSVLDPYTRGDHMTLSEALAVWEVELADATARLDAVQARMDGLMADMAKLLAEHQATNYVLSPLYDERATAEADVLRLTGIVAAARGARDL